MRKYRLPTEAGRYCHLLATRSTVTPCRTEVHLQLVQFVRGKDVFILALGESCIRLGVEHCCHWRRHVLSTRWGNHFSGNDPETNWISAAGTLTPISSPQLNLGPHGSAARFVEWSSLRMMSASQPLPCSLQCASISPVITSLLWWRL